MCLDLEGHSLTEHPRRMPAKTKITTGLLAAVLLWLLQAAAASAGQVAVISSADVDAYKEALRGFKKTVRHQIVAEYDMEGNLEAGKKILSDIQSKIKPT